MRYQTGLSSDVLVVQNYLQMLDYIHCLALPRTYLEIGVNSGQSLALSLPGSVAIGIDPKPMVAHAMPRNSLVFRMTSDEFFAMKHPRSLLGGSIDLSFIDGMHLFEYALRDFCNVEKASSAKATVLIHDCLPLDRASAQRKRTTRQWTGDVWKLIVCLRVMRPELKIATIDVEPTGLVMVTNLRPESRVLLENYEEILGRFIGLDYDQCKKRLRRDLNLVPPTIQEVNAMLPVAPFRSSNVMVARSLRSLRIPTTMNLGQIVKNRGRRLAHSLVRRT
jgi:hypothetical protein